VPNATHGILGLRSRRVWAEVVEARLVELSRSRRDLAAALASISAAKLGRALNGSGALTLGEAMLVLAELGLEVRPVGELAVTILYPPRSPPTRPRGSRRSTPARAAPRRTGARPGSPRGGRPDP
jgi:hypothetical protein